MAIEQCRGNSLAANVADGQDKPLGIEGQEVVVVAAYRTRRPTKSMDFERCQLLDMVREELRLHFLSDHQFVLQLLFFFLLLDQFFERCSHRVEGIGQSGNLIVRLHWNAMAEIAAIDVGGGVIELGDSARHRASQAGADNERDRFQ